MAVVRSDAAAPVAVAGARSGKMKMPSRSPGRKNSSVSVPVSVPVGVAGGMRIPLKMLGPAPVPVGVAGGRRIPLKMPSRSPPVAVAITAAWRTVPGARSGADDAGEPGPYPGGMGIPLKMLGPPPVAVAGVRGAGDVIVAVCV